MLDSRTVELLGDDRDRFGRARAWGSIAFIGVSLGVGLLIDRMASAAGLFLVYVPSLVLVSVAAHTLLGGRARGDRVRPRFSSLDLVGLLRDRRLTIFLGGSILVWTATSALSTFLSVHLVTLGGDARLVGLVWALGALIEVPLMFGFPTLARRIGAERLLVLGALAFALRAAGFAIASDVAAIVLIAPLGGVGFALFYVGTVSYVARTAPASVQATAQGIFSGTAFSVGTIIGSVAGGQVAGALSLRGLFGIAAVATIAAALVVWWAILAARGPSGVRPA